MSKTQVALLCALCLALSLLGYRAGSIEPALIFSFGSGFMFCWLLVVIAEEE